VPGYDDIRSSSRVFIYLPSAFPRVMYRYENDIINLKKSQGNGFRSAPEVDCIFRTDSLRQSLPTATKADEPSHADFTIIESNIEKYGIANYKQKTGFSAVHLWQFLIFCHDCAVSAASTAQRGCRCGTCQVLEEFLLHLTLIILSLYLSRVVKSEISSSIVYRGILAHYALFSNSQLKPTLTVVVKCQNCESIYI
jgi:hypothetical protein